MIEKSGYEIFMADSGCGAVEVEEIKYRKSKIK
jgi:hypothetical protein